jgi:GNAT superfamily N-acetyltransferase
LFAENGLSTDVCLCLLVDLAAIQLLTSRGYIITHWLNSYVRVLTDEDLEEVKVEGVSVSRLSIDRVHEFPAWSVAGYIDGGRAELLLETLGRISVLREDENLYLATVDGKIAGSGCMAPIETSKGGVAHLHLDSTLPEFPGRGVQAAPLKARLADARKAGYDLASIAARPGNNGSCRNIERAGFSLAYTKTWCTKAHE